MVAEWYPRYFEVWPISAPTEEECDRHFLWRFWQKLPGSQDINVFDRSWYGRVLVERVENLCSEAEWRRAYDEINEFEAQQIDSGTNIVKLFVHTRSEEHTSELKSLMRISYAVFCLKKKNITQRQDNTT